jgi:hypothetical protein
MSAPGQDKAFVVESQGVPYSLDLDINGMCALEEVASTDEGQRVTFQEVCSRIDMRTVRLVVWAAMLKHHPDADLKLAGQVATDLTRSGQVEALMRQVMADATPAPEDATALGMQSTNPRKAQTRRKAGTGPRSTAPRGARE